MLLALAVAITAGMFIDGATGKSFAMTGPDCIACHDGNGVPGEPWYNIIGSQWNKYTPELEPDGTMMNEHHYYVAERKKYSCYKCHPNNSTKTLGVCINCHYPGSTFGKGNALDITEAHEPKHDWTDVPQTMCSDCHEGNVFAEHSGRAQFADTEGDLKCTLCHSNTNQTVTDTAEFGGGHPGGLTYCDDCHISLSGTGTHGPAHNILFDEVDCTTSGCHVQDVVQEHFDRDRTCSTCHAGETYDSDPALVQQVILDTGTGKSCSSCHGTNRHHTSPNAAVGNCEYCHADPRLGISPDPSWNAAPGDSDWKSGVNVPTQMACRQCHVKFDGTSMKVYRFSRSNYVSYTLDYDSAVVHTIPNTIGQINNYGICFDCHGPAGQGMMDAPLVTVWHARPDKHDSSWVAGQHRDIYCTYSRFTAGRSSGTISKFNLFNDYKQGGFGWPVNLDYDWDPCPNWEQYKSSPYTFTRIALQAVPGNGMTSGSVPVFPGVCPRTTEGVFCPTHQLTAPTLYTEPDMTCPDNCSVTFEWQPVNVAYGETVGYYLQIDDDPFFNSVDYESDPVDWQTETSAIVTLATDKTWYWRVKAHDNLNPASVSPWSSSDSFYMLYAPEGTYTFNFTGPYAQHLYIPPGVSSVTITALGAGGGGGRPDEGTYTPGQSGDKAVSTIPTSGDITLDIYVAQGGKKGNSLSFWPGGYGGYGNPIGANGENGEDDGLVNAYDWAFPGAGGGGASTVLLDGSVLVRARGGNGGKSGDYTGEGGCSGGICIGGSGGAGGGPSSGDSVYPGLGADGGDTTPSDGTNGQVLIWFN